MIGKNHHAFWRGKVYITYLTFPLKSHHSWISWNILVLFFFKNLLWGSFKWPSWSSITIWLVPLWLIMCSRLEEKKKKKVNSRNKELFMKMGKVDYRNLILDPWTYTGPVLITMVMQYSGKDMNIEGNKIFW